jgi:hypothetical protein
VNRTRLLFVFLGLLAFALQGIAKNPRHQRKSKISPCLLPIRNQSEVSREFILGQFLTTGSMSLFDWIT